MGNRVKALLAVGFAVLSAATVLLGTSFARRANSATTDGPVRTYYIAADEVEWDYTPSGKNVLFNRPFSEMEAEMTVSGPRRIGSKYRKAIYREYTDATFAHL